MSMPVIEVPVLIVGAGPAGLTASLLLSKHGMPHVLIDKRTGDSQLPRARGVHARAMEILRLCGIEADLLQTQLSITPGAEWRANLTGVTLREDVPSAAVGPDVSPCEGLSVSQDVFEGVLRRHVVDRAQADVRLGVSLDGFHFTANGVVANVSDRSGQRTEVRARWMIAADGAHSRVRECLGIGMSGPADLGTQRMIAFRADLSRYTGERPRGIYFLTAVGAALIWTHPDHRWVLNLPDSLSDQVQEPQAMVRDALGILDIEIEILATGRWTAAAQLATRLSHGLVFLIGDAAHCFPPIGATGMSTAINDAHNLAWKLAAVARGHGGPALLDSYSGERTPVAARNADETGKAWSRVFTASNAPFAGRSLTQIDMGYQYRSSVIIPDGSADADPPGSDYTPSGAPGCRAPHMWLNTSTGRISTIDLFHDRFVVLTTPSGQRWLSAATRAANEIDVPLAVHVIEESDWPASYGIRPDGAVLVRPDGHIAWRHRGGQPDTDPTTELCTTLGTALARDKRSAGSAPPSAAHS